MKNGGDAKVTQAKKRLGLCIPEKLYKEIKAEAEYRGRTINSICLEILWKFFDDPEVKDKF